MAVKQNFNFTRLVFLTVVIFVQITTAIRLNTSGSSSTMYNNHKILNNYIFQSKVINNHFQIFV